MTPSTTINGLINRILTPYAPEGLDKVHLFDDISGTTANDFALRSAFIKHHTWVTGKEVNFSNFGEEMGKKVSYKVISFSGAYHGGSLAALSASTHHQKFNLPNFDWTILPYPETKE